MDYHKKYIKYKNLYLKIKKGEQEKPIFKKDDIIYNIKKNKKGIIICLRDEIYEQESWKLGGKYHYIVIYNDNIIERYEDEDVLECVL